MEIRRRLMMIGGSAMVGELSKYQKISTTPSQNIELEIAHTLGVKPKIVILTSEQTYVSATYLVKGIFDQNCGSIMSFDTSGNLVPNAYLVFDNYLATNARATITDTSVIIRRVSSARYFDTNTTYTVELYA